MGKRFLALFLSALIVFTEITSGQITFCATEVTDENGQSEDGTALLFEGEESGDETEAEYVYYFEHWNNVDILPYHEINISRTVGYSNVSLAEGEEGRDGEILVNGITVTDSVGNLIAVSDENGISSSNTEVLECWSWGDDNGDGQCDGWTLKPVQQGNYAVNISYNSPEGDSCSYEFTIACGSEVSYAYINNCTQSTWLAAPEETITLAAGYNWECYDEENGHYNKYGNNVTYSWTFELLGSEVAADTVATCTSTQEDGAVYDIRFTADASNYEGSVLSATVVAKDGDTEIGTASYGITISTDYYAVNIMENEEDDIYLHNVEVGESTTFEPYFHHVTYRPESDGSEVNVLNTNASVDGTVTYGVDYDTNILEVTESSGVYTVKRIGSDYTGITLHAYVNGDEVASHSAELYEQNYRVWFDNLNDGDNVYAYVDTGAESGDTLKVYLNTCNLTGKNAEVKWEVGRDWDENGENYTDLPKDCYSISTDEEGYTILVIDTKKAWKALNAGESDETGFGVRAVVYAKDTEYIFHDCWTHVTLKREREEYQFNFDTNDYLMLPTHTKEIQNRDNCYRVWNAQYPYGNDFELKITSVTAVNTESDAVIVENWDDSNGDGYPDGWTVRANAVGNAILTYAYTYTYTYYEGEEEKTETITGERTLNICVTDDAVWTDFYSANGTDCILPGETFGLSVNVNRECYNYDEAYCYGGSLEGYGYQWELGDENLENSVTMTANGLSVTVTAKEELLYGSIPLVFKVYAPEGSDPVIYKYYIQVVDGYWELQPVNMDAMEIGDEITVTPELKWHAYNSNAAEGEKATVETRTDAVFRWENWDTSCIQITDAQSNTLGDGNNQGTVPFTLKKLENWDADLRLIAGFINEDGNFEEASRHDWWMCAKNYDVWMNDVNEGEGIVLWANNDADSNGEEVEVSVNAENYAGKENVTIEWLFGYYVETEETDEEGNAIYVFENALTLEAGTHYTLSEDKTIATFYANKLLSAIQDYNSNYGHCNFEVVFKVNGIEVGRTGHWLEVRQEREEYNFNIGDEIAMLPGLGNGFDSNIEVCVENKDTEGEVWSTIFIEKVTIENHEDETEDTSAGATVRAWDDRDGNGYADGWDIQANRFGHAVATIHYTDVNGEDATKEIQIYVCDQVPYLDMNGSRDIFMPGETVTVEGSFGINAYDAENDRYYQAECSGYSFTWSVADENLSQYVTLTDVATGDENKSAVSVALADTNELFGNWIPVELVVCATDENGKEYEVTRNRYHIEVVGEYYKVSDLPNLDLAIGETMEYTPGVTYHKYGEEAVDVENLNYYLYWDTSAIEIADADGNKVEVDETGEGQYITGAVTIKRLAGYSAYIRCNAQETDESGEYSDLAGEGWYLTDYSLCFDSRGDGMTWMYVNNADGLDEDYVLSVDRTTGSLDGYTIDWYIGIYDENEEFKAMTNSDAYTVSEDGISITLHSGELLDALAELIGEEGEIGGISFTIGANLIATSNDTTVTYSTQEIYTEIRSATYKYFQSASDVTNMPSWQINFSKARTAYIEDKNYPYGYDWDFELESFEIVDENEDTLESSEIISVEAIDGDEDGSVDTWVTTSNSKGTAYVKMTYTDIYSNEAYRIVTIYVTDDHYVASISSESNHNQMLPGSSTTLQAELYHYIYKNDELKDVEINGTLKCDWWVDNGAITLEKDEEHPEKVHISVGNRDECGTDYWCNVYVRIYEEDSEAEAAFSIYVCDDYYQLFTDDTYYAEPGDEVEVSGVLKYFSVDAPEGEIISENVVYGIKVNGDNTDVTIDGATLKVSENADVPENDYTGQWFMLTAAVGTEGEEDYIYTECGSLLVICNHNYEEVGRLDETCTDAGYIVRRCAICEHETIEERDALGHKSVVDKAVAATCTETGLTEGSHCSRCNKVLKEQTVVKALGHNNVTDKAVAATCTETGLTEGTHCSRCSTVTKAQTVVKALGHNSVVDKAVAPTCTTDGKTEGSHCSRCNTVLKAQTAVKALGHNSVVDKAVAPTCTTDGKTEGSHCSRCNTVLKAQTVIKATGHSYEEILTKATMSVDGSIVKKCKTCGNVASTTTIAKIASVTLADEEYTYNGKAKNPAVTVKDSKGAVLAKDKDYTVNYASGCKNPGQYEVKVTFIGNYEGTKSLYFTIAPKAIKISSLTPDKKTFTAKWTTTTGSGYEIAYSTSEKFTKSTTKTVTVSGQSSKSKKITGLKATEKYYVRIRAYVTITVNKKETKLYGEWSDVETVITETAKGKISAIKSVTLSEDEYQYDGKVKKPSVIIKDKAGNTLEEGVDYKVSYASGRKNPGSYKVMVTYIGNYKSLKKVTLYFTIAPKGVAIKKLTATSKGFKVTYAKGSNNTGYEIQYSTSKKFTKSTTKSVTISKAKTTSKTISKLKGNKTYYVRIRTYKTVKVNGKSVKVYSDWSGAKSVKTKK